MCNKKCIFYSMFMLLWNLLITQQIISEENKTSLETVNWDAVNWTLRNYDEVIEHLNPSALDPIEKIRHKWSVTFRISSSSDLGGEFLCILFTREEACSLSCVMPEEKSIYDQMTLFKEANPEGTVEDFISGLSLKKINVTSRECPRLFAFSQALEAMKLPVVDSSDRKFCIHCTAYQYYWYGFSRSIEISILGDSHPLSAWMESVRKYVLEECLPQKEKDR